MSYLKKIIDLLLYGNFWIALCASALLLQSQRIFGRPLAFDALVWFVFSATLFLYAVHRIVGIAGLHKYFDLDRYAVIARYKHHIQIYAVAGVLGMLVFFWKLSTPVQLALIIPGALSLAYVIPFLRGKRKRIRDFDHIKIFLIALVWSWITVGLPALEYGIQRPLFIALMCAERALFIFAITLPFDIRDLKIDRHSSVKTIPGSLGAGTSRAIGYAALLGTAALAFFSFQADYYSPPVFYGLLCSVLTTAVLLFFSTPERHDYFYSGLMDGTMLFQFLLIELMFGLLN